MKHIKKESIIEEGGNSLSRKIILILTISSLFLLLTGFSKQQINNSLISKENVTKRANIIKSANSPEAFLKLYRLTVKGNPEKFNVNIPSALDVKAGDYPIGLYWRLVNEFSKDAGLDLTPFKGTSAEVWRYALKDGLPGQGEQSNFIYQSDVILLVKSSKVIGAWLNINHAGIGPSVKKHYLKDITGLSYDEWVDKENLFSLTDKNKDLAKLEPVGVLKAFFKAIKDGDKKRAYSCLSPNEMLDSLTMNFGGNCLYNPGFNRNNSMVENIIKAKPISFKLLDNKNLNDIIKTTGRKEIEVAVTLELEWRDSVFNSPDGKEIRFTIMGKYKNGWKIGSLGTGP